MDPIFQATLSDLQAELQRQRDEITFLRTIVTTRASARPKPSLPDPEKFTGHAYKFDTWLPSIKAKLRIDGDAIGDATAQFYYVYLNLDSQVQAMVLPQLAQAETTSPDYNTILDQLVRVYDNPNKIQEAEDKLFALKQGADSALVYIAKYERLLYEAHGQNWPDVNKISIFRNGLNSTIRNRLAQQLTLPSTYSGFVRIIQQLAGRSSSFFLPSASHNNSDRQQQSDPMEIAAIATTNTRRLARGRVTADTPALLAYPYEDEEE